MPSLLTVRQVAALLSVSETTVYRLKRRGEISFVKIGSSLRFRPADVAEYENRQSVTALGNAQQERPEPPKLHLAFPLKRRRSGRMQEAYMATIKQRPQADGGGYQVRFYAPDGSRRSKTFAKIKDAEQFATKSEADKLRGQWLDPKLAKTPFEEVAAIYLDGLVHLAPSTRMKVEGHLRNYILPTFRRFQVANINPSDVRSWISAMMKHGLSPATVKAIHGTFSRVINQAVLDGMIPRSPSFGVKLPKEDPADEMNVIESEKLVALAEALDPRFRTLIYTAAYSGLRWSELVALKVHNLDCSRAPST